MLADRTAVTPVGASRAIRIGLGGWAAIVILGVIWGTLAIADAGQSVRAAPLSGNWAWHGGRGLVPAALLALVATALAPRLAVAPPRRQLLALTAASAAAWTLLLAASDGWSQVRATLEGPHDFLPFATSIDDPGRFLRTFTDVGSGYPVHVRGHPPGATLLYTALDRVGLGGAGWGAALTLLAWGVTAAAVVFTVGEVAGADRARRAAPFIAFAPAAVWAGTSADPVYAAATAVGTALVVSATARTGRPSIILAAMGGLGLGLAAHLTYGALPLFLVPAAVLVLRRRADLVAAAAAAGAVGLLAPVLAGFWWFDGLSFTRTEYWRGVASRRDTTYFLVAGNPAAFALAVGPAVGVALACLRRADWARWLLVAAALVAVLVADLSALSKAEVERIWLPYVPWIVAACAWLPRRWVRSALAAQCTTGLFLQAALVATW